MGVKRTDASSNAEVCQMPVRSYLDAQLVEVSLDIAHSQCRVGLCRSKLQLGVQLFDSSLATAEREREDVTRQQRSDVFASGLIRPWCRSSASLALLHHFIFRSFLPPPKSLGAPLPLSLPRQRSASISPEPPLLLSVYLFPPPLPQPFCTSLPP